MKTPFLVLTALLMALGSRAQVNSGSNGSDGALDLSSLANPAGYSTSTNINMADHPTGIYQYTSVNIPALVSVMFTPNAKNTPVIWLVQSNVVINGTITVSGHDGNGLAGGLGGPGGYAGGNGGVNATSGQGPGGGIFGNNGGFASYGSLGQANDGTPPGSIYGNSYLIPLIGGSGGGGANNTVGGGCGGGGGGGAILIASSTKIQLDGGIVAYCGNRDTSGSGNGGAGSGGAIRLVASTVAGTGWINTGPLGIGISAGRIRIDTFQNSFAGYIGGVFSAGSQFIIIPTSGQLPQLTVTSVGGILVSASPTGQLVTPDAVLSSQQANPIPVVVNCSNLPLNTAINVTIKPANGSAVSATGYNATGTLSSSTATISIVIPRGGGLIYATAATAN